MLQLTLAIKKDIKAYYAYHDIVVVWSSNKVKVMYMSKVSNLKMHDKEAKSTFVVDVTQGCVVWTNRHKPQLAKLGGIHSIEWNVSCHAFNNVVSVFLTYLRIGRSPSAHAFEFIVS